MRLKKRESPMQRLRATVSDSLATPVRKKLHLGTSDKALKTSLIVAGGVTGLTAGSAGISSLRRRVEGPRDQP